MLYKGLVFNNYIDICNYLSEDSKAGNSKRAQLRRWETQFKFHKEGNKIIIDEVYDEPRKVVSKRDSNNHKYMDIYLPLIHYGLYENLGNRVSISKLVCETLNIVNSKMFKNIYEDNPEYFEMDEKEFRKFKSWAGKIRQLISGDIIKGINRLQKKDLIRVTPGYAFLAKEKRTKYVASVAGFEDYICEAENEACDKLNRQYKISSKMTGKQLLYLISQNQTKRVKYFKMVINKIKQNPELMTAIQKSINEQFTGIDFGSENYPIKTYWKVWTVTEMDAPPEIDIEQYRRDYIVQLIQRAGDAPEKWKQLLFIN